MSRWVLVGRYFTALKDEQTHKPMEDHTKSLQHTQAQRSTAVAIYYGLLNTNAHCESNQILPTHFLGYSSCSGLR